MAGVSTFTQAKADAICEHLYEGRTIRQIAQLEAVSTATICKWLCDFTSFAEQYARAKEHQAEILADEIIAIADSAKTGEDAQVARVRVDSRKWVAAKLLPKKYGDKLQLEGSVIHLNLPASVAAEYANRIESHTAESYSDIRLLEAETTDDPK